MTEGLSYPGSSSFESTRQGTIKSTLEGSLWTSRTWIRRVCAHRISPHCGLRSAPRLVWCYVEYLGAATCRSGAPVDHFMATSSPMDSIGHSIDSGIIGEGPTAPHVHRACSELPVMHSETMHDSV
ncbi:hypothetical protein PsYK624_028320 [Phanerochaete sordida]|uniref:Uncharacterized protein n=1 Tax=Phanerochaete sordida TaxID=48140 RepID=A0A9P3G1X3_9APHY|nr:hypothetical protein PsYK624_028320 [Phanerochaete sordida]